MTTTQPRLQLQLQLQLYFNNAAPECGIQSTHWKMKHYKNNVHSQNCYVRNVFSICFGQNLLDGCCSSYGLVGLIFDINFKQYNWI